MAVEPQVQQFIDFIRDEMPRRIKTNPNNLPDAQKLLVSVSGTLEVIYKTLAELDIAIKSDVDTALSSKEPTITAGTSAQYYRGDKTFQPLNTNAVTESTDKRYLSDAQKTIATQAATSTLSGYLSSTDWSTFNGKQAALVSGDNIKSVNGNSLLGSGDLVVSDENAVQRGSGNTVTATSEVVKCTNVTVIGANCVVSNSTNLNVTGDNLNIEGLRYDTLRTLTFPHGSHIVGRKSTQGLYVTASSAFRYTKPPSSTVVLADSAGIKPYIGFPYYGSYQDVAYHRVTVMCTLNANNYAVFAVSTRRNTSVTVTPIQAGGGYITLTAADDGAGRLTLTVGTTYTDQDIITAYVESHYGNYI